METVYKYTIKDLIHLNFQQVTNPTSFFKSTPHLKLNPNKSNLPD